MSNDLPEYHAFACFAEDGDVTFWSADGKTLYSVPKYRVSVS